uniref:Uncharacterized protein n=1 Tax=Glossina pallidipes TaxID=7398 RepID=A0A1A9ZBH9_GLOPL
MRENTIRFIPVNSGGTEVENSELEEFETPARYRPDSLSALSRSTRFTEDEIKRIYRGFKAECPTGVVKEDTFKVIYSQFFPQGGSYAKANRKPFLIDPSTETLNLDLNIGPKTFLL